VLQGGNELCRIEGFDRGKAVSELKVSIEAEAGFVPVLTRLTNPESHVELQDHLTLEDACMLSEQALAEGVIQLYAQKLKKVVVADELQIAPGEVTDSKLAVFCDSIRDDATDILVLCGCSRVTSISCLVQLSTISHLEISGCNLGVTGCFHLAVVIKDMGALTSLDLSSNQLTGGTLLDTPNHNVLPLFTGVTALADTIPNMRALTSLNLSANHLKAEGAKIVAEAIKVTKCAIAVVLAPSSCMPIWPLAELLLFTTIHRITGHYPRLS
jgi:hypothetical protein